MKKRFLAFVFISLFIIQFSDLTAQDSPINPSGTVTAVYFGPLGGFNRSLHTVELKSFVDDAKCPVFSDGSANGFFAGAFFEWPLGKVGSSKHTLIFRGMYSMLPSSLTVKGDRYPSLVTDAGSSTGYKTVWTVTEHNVDVTYDVASIDILYRFNFLGDLGLVVGPTFDISLANNIKQKYQLIEPLNVQFIPDDQYVYEDNGRTIIVLDEEVPNSKPYRVGVKLGLQYEILTGTKWDILPSIFYNLGLTNLSDTEDWRVDILQIGVDIRYSL